MLFVSLQIEKSSISYHINNTFLHDYSIKLKRTIRETYIVSGC